MTMNDAERAAKISKIANLPLLAEEALRGLSEAQLDTPYRTGGWTVRQVIHHLADSHMNAFLRTKLILTEDNPTLKTYDQDSWANTPDASLFSVEASLSMLRGLHGRWAHLFRNTAANGWKRTAMHPEKGLITLDDILELYARHGENHVAQITGLRDARGW